MSATDQRLAKLTPAQRALLEQRLRQRPAAATSAATIPRRPDDVLRCSRSVSAVNGFCSNSNRQCRLSPLQRQPVAGSLDVAALRRAIDALVNRHSALRTTYAMGDTEPLQTVQPPTAILCRWSI